jgi:hypothetical protein
MLPPLRRDFLKVWSRVFAAEVEFAFDAGPGGRNGEMAPWF